jgi:hypothetical protein
MRHFARHAFALAVGFSGLPACKDMHLEDPMISHRAVDDDETQRKDAAYTRIFNDTRCPRASTTLTKRTDVKDVYDVTACGSQYQYKCTSESVATRSNRTGEHKAEMVYQCAPFTDAGAP